ERRTQSVKLIRNILRSASRSEEFTHDREHKNVTAAQFLERRKRLTATRVKGRIEQPKKFSAGSSATRRRASALAALWCATAPLPRLRPWFRGRSADEAFHKRTPGDEGPSRWAAKYARVQSTSISLSNLTQPCGPQHGHRSALSLEPRRPR